MDAAASLELSIQRNSIPMICGPMGCGKSILIDYVARKLKASTSRVQISEQTDTKTLIGMYCCSDTPGVFVWRPGPLVHCMTSGKWLILEDVDKGSADLPILLSPLLRQADDSISGLLHPNTGNPVIRHPDFRLILTRRTVGFGTSFSQLNSVSDIYATYCCMIYMQAMTSSAIERIVCTRFPSVLPIAKRLLAEFALLKNMSTTSSSDERSVTPRDFLKFCARANSLADFERNAEGLYLDAIDCFVCSQPPSQLREKLAITLGGLFNFTTDRSSDLWKDRKPELYLNTQMTKVIAGRVSIPAKRSIQWELQLSSMASTSGPFAGQTFADTRLACSLIERLAAAVYHKEPVLLVGETGTGKTSSIQRLALMAGRRLRVLNLNQQSDSVDLLGGFKPVDNRALINPTRERFESLFVRTFRMETNKQFLHHIQTCSATGRWRDLLSLMRHPAITAISRLSVHKDNTEVDDEAGKKARPNVTEWKALLAELDSLQTRLASAERAGQPSLAFAFIEGALVRAVKEGDWVLLDEINLAPAELLDCLSGLLDSSAGSLTLVDRGDLEPVKRHPSFHLFAAMNPSTDVGKRSLPIGLRNRFTEIYVDELNPAASTVDMNDLTLLIRTYLVGLSPSAAQIAAVVQLYTAIRRAAVEGLVDGVGQRPYFSLRTLCRALTEASRGYHGSLLRSLYEGFLFSFGSQVGRSSRPALEKLIQTHLLSTVVSSSVGKQKTSPEALSRQLFSRPLPSPVSKSPVTAEAEEFVCVEGYWIPKGPLAARAVAVNCVADGDYILTTSVRANLKDLARVVAAAGSLPVLLQGETSVGKTSLITYLAERVGQVCHRINNHEHTDLQTYLGTYTASSVSESAVSSRDDIPSARPLVFQEGIFVQAMRKGHWIILDELNLAPTEILEALNRVLDENRELFITETQEMVRAHPHFRVFATQNPPGLYAGRKVLSRALRNRFVELHFDPLPRNELEIILEHRSALPPSRAKKLVEVMHQLQLLRRSSEVFQGKDGFITLRDLFRWGERYRLASCVEASSDAGQQSFDWDTYLAEQGYLLLGGRARRAEEAAVVAEVIRKTFNRQINERNLFDHHSGSSLAVAEFLALASSKGVTSTAETGQGEKKLSNEFEHVVWTRDMRRLLVLVGNALKYKEPVLLVGETGCGKTTICQIFANIRGQQLHCVNCHQYTEASDFLGGLRPVRGSDGPSCTDNMESDSTVDSGRLFEWVDGPLVKAMLSGDMFLLDEISLADDAVLERLNSILEPERRLCLAERCGEGGEVSLASAENDDPAANIVAATDFRLVATMNPGGDYAKKELSPALRNRFTEIWCPSPLFSKLPPSAVCSSTANTVVETTVEGLEDWRSIVEHNFVLRSGNPDLVTRLWRPLAASMVDFCWWFAFKRNETVGCSTCRRPMPTVRDLLAWVEFVHNITDTHGSAQPDMFSTYTTSCLHGACLLFLDSLQNTNDDNVEGQDVRAWFGDIWEQRGKISDDLFPFSQVGGLSYLFARLLIHFDATVVESNHLSQQMLEAAVRVMETVDSAGPVTHAPPLPCLTDSNARYGIPPFLIETGPLVSPELVDSTHAPLPFSLAAPTPAFNLCRLLRALQLPRRALLLEGSPGVGKTSLVMALARASGHKVVRINLSEATEASDLFGCDLPVEGASCGTFAWSDGPLLQALRHGHWILLDEMNLASQSVLECLNACLDHRGSIFIPELGATFHVKPRATRLFACQNPVEEGGGRKALPKSFLNRFTQVYLKPLTLADQQVVLSSLYPSIPRSSVTAMVNFNAAIHNAANFGMNPGLYVCLLYAGRMRTAEDKEKVMDLWHEVAASVAATEADFDEATSRCYLPQGRLSVLGDKHLQVGLASFRIRDQSAQAPVSQLLLLHQHRSYLELLLKTLELGWMPIVVGPRGSGKRSLVHLAAYLTRNKISSLSLSPSADTVELLGAFEQQEAGGVFAWIDSPLVKGIREGHWVMLENAQLCSPSVLDRLNGLLEPGGELILSERGLDASGNLVRLTPHPNFRFILTVDEEPLSAGPGATNISRAMRNRGVELALTHDLTVSHEDVHRLLLAMRLPNQHAAALLHFDTACAQSIPHLLLHPTSAEGTEEGSQLTLLQSSRKLPIGALLSAGLILQQLLDLLPGDDEFSKSDLLAWTAGPVNEAECRADGAVWLLQSKYSRVQRAYLKVLEDVYVRRHQTDRRLAEAYHEAVLQFVENDLPTILNREHHAPSSPVHHIDQAPLVNRVTDLLKPVPGSINLPLPGVGHWLDCLRLALQDLPSEPSPSLDNHDAVPFLLRRQIMERLPLAGEKTVAAISSPLRSSVLSSVLESAEEFTKVGSTDLLDLRWIPGWRVLMNADPTILPMDPEKLVKSWDRHLVHTYFNHLCSYFAHVDQLLAAEADTAGNSQKPQLSLPPDLPVLVAAAKLVRGDYPAAWSETYPGLMHLRREWKKGVRMHLEAHLTAASIDLYELLRSTGRLLTWIHLFASTALGSPSDWPERIEFYRSKARITDLTAPPERVLVLLHRHRIAPQPRSEDSVSFGRRRPSSLLSTSWAALAAAVCDQLAAAAVNEDYASTKNDSDYEMLTAGKTEETAPFTLPIGSRLWPLLASIAVLVSMQSFSATGAYDCGSVTLAWNPINSQRPPIELGLTLGALCRPTLLKLLATSTSSETLGSVGWLQNCLLLLCGTSSSLSPSEIFNQPGLRIPDVKNEWGSLSQALFLTNCGNRLSSTLGPQSTQYRCSPQTITCSFADWLLHQQTSCDIYHLLIRFSDPCLQRMTTNFTAEFDEAVTLSERLLLSISTALGRAWPENIPVSSCDALTPERSTSTDLSCRMNALNSQLGLVLEKLPPNSPVRLKTLLMRFTSLLQDLPALLPSVVDMGVLSQFWLLWGCLQLLCACPVSPLDPTLVTAHKIAECERELAALSCDLSLRSAVNRVQFGSCGLPCLIANDSVISSANRVQPRHCGCTDSTTLLSNVAAGLEHPLVGAIVRRRDKVASRLEQLRSLRPSSLVSALLQLRQSSNAKYTELRSRLQTFTADFVEPLLALVSEQPNGASPADLVMKFTEAAAELSEWLLSPDRLHPYADIIEPYLLGLSKILRSLRLRMHASVFNIPQATDFVRLVELLSCGVFPLLACTGAPGDDPQQRRALSPYLELARQLVSQGTRARLRDLWLQPLSPHTTSKARSIFTDAQEVQASKRLFAVRAMQADYRLSSYALDLLLLAVLSTSKLRHMETDDSALVARLLRALNCHLAARWRRNEERLKRDAQRRAALFVEAESKRRRCLDQLQASTAGGRSQKKRKKSKKNADQEDEDRQLPALVDPDLDEEVEWRLRFPETGAIEARRCLLGGDNFSLEMNLSRDDQIRQAVNQIENVQSWLNRELASEETARDWLPPESELADFVNRLLYLLCLLSPLCPPQATENVEEVRSQHWWNTFMQGYQFAGDLVATTNYPLPHSHDAVSSAAHLLATAKFALLAHSGNPETAGRNLFSLEPLLAVPASSQQLLRRKPYLDVYRDPIPFSEAHVAQSITERLRTRVQEVLREWPDHPALLKVLSHPVLH
nr:unnamed protein product [Spirometra erinaceieuropaei]